MFQRGHAGAAVRRFGTSGAPHACPSLPLSITMVDMGVMVERYLDPEACRRVVEPFMLDHEAENNLPLGIIRALAENPDGITADNVYLGVGRRDGEVVGFGVWTHGHRCVLSWPDDAQFGRAVGRALRSVGLEQSGVLGPNAAAVAFAEVWRDAGWTVVDGMPQLVYRLASVADVPRATGALRAATPADRNLLVEWWMAFAQEADLDPVPRPRAESAIAARLAAASPQLFVWDDDGPVAMASARAGTANGIRIGGVFTPPALRGRGYATSMMADLSSRLLAEGRRFCFLFTDARNPTSNAMYQRIGYELVAPITELRFTRPVAGASAR